MIYPSFLLSISLFLTIDCYAATNGNYHQSIHNSISRRSEPLTKIRNSFILKSFRGGSDELGNPNNEIHNQNNNYAATALSKEEIQNNPATNVQQNVNTAEQYSYEQQQQQQQQQQNEQQQSHNQQYYGNENEQQQQQEDQSMYQQQSPDQYYSENPVLGIDILQQETEQDRITDWKNKQIKKSLEKKNAFEVHDENGRLNLFAGVGKGTRGILFFILMCRDMHLIDVAESSFRNSNPLFVKLFVTIPLCCLFIANLSGMIVALSPPSSAEQHYSKSKKRLKAILNLDKMIEIFLIMYSFSKLTIFPSKYIQKEIYISSIIHSTFFILQSHGVTKLAWYDVPPKLMGGDDNNIGDTTATTTTS